MEAKEIRDILIYCYNDLNRQGQHGRADDVKAVDQFLKRFLMSEEDFRREIEAWNGRIEDWSHSTERKCWEILTKTPNERSS